MNNLISCLGIDCKVKDGCKRYTKKIIKGKTYFDESPIKEGVCDMYWGVNQINIIDQLKEIMK